MSDKRDQLYRQENSSKGSPQSLNAVGSFKFDARVADVFNDMISRSVPGYQQILEMLPTLVKQISLDECHQEKRYYDLGCSLGAGMLAISQGLTKQDSSNQTIIGIDNSADMLTEAKTKLAAFNEFNFELKQQNIQQTQISNAALVLMNFTLQFIPLDERSDIIKNIYHGLNKGGALILSEKIKFENSKTHQLLTDIHHQYKADQGYSQLEIAKKRDAIENVLIPETLDNHIQRLKGAGFKVVTPWVQNLQFVSILAIK